MGLRMHREPGGVVGASLRMRRETSWFGLMLMDCNVCGDGPGVHQCGVCVCKRDVGMHRCGCKEMNPQGNVGGAECQKNSVKRLYSLKGLLVLVEKASFSNEFQLEFHSGAGGYTFYRSEGMSQHFYIWRDKQTNQGSCQICIWKDKQNQGKSFVLKPKTSKL